MITLRAATRDDLGALADAIAFMVGLEHQEMTLQLGDHGMSVSTGLVRSEGNRDTPSQLSRELILMYGQMTSPDLPNQMYQQLIRIGDQERLGRRILRERKAARKSVRRQRRRTAQPRPVIRTA